MQALGLRVANVAAYDLALGPGALLALQDSTGVPFVSANVFVNDSPFFRPYVVLDATVNGRTVGIGITGITMKTQRAFDAWPDSLVGRFADAVASARAVLDVLEPQTDMQILLAALPASEVDKLARELPGYEVLVSGAGDLREPPPRGPVPVVLAPGTKCKFLGWTALRTGAGQSLVVTAADLVHLDAGVADQPAMAKRVQTMKRRLGETTVPPAVAREAGPDGGARVPH